MQPREKKLAIAVALLLTLALGFFGFGAVRDALDTRAARLTGLEQEVMQREAEVRRGEAALRRRQALVRRSLPSDRPLARSLYQNWLLSQVEKAQVADVELSSQLAGSRPGMYDRLAFSVSGRGSLEQIVRLLHAFHEAGHLHQVRRMSVKPGDNPRQLQLNLGVEVLLLPQARGTSIPDEPVRRLQHGPVDAYAAKIVGRNFFAPYSPPPPPPRVASSAPAAPKPPSFDPAKFAFVTGILSDSSGRPEVWLNVRTTGETLRLGVGESFQVGALQATVAQISARQVVLVTEGKRLQVGLGQNLREATPLDDGG